MRITTFARLISVMLAGLSTQAPAFDVASYRIVDLTHPYGEETLYWPSRSEPHFELEQRTVKPRVGISTQRTSFVRRSMAGHIWMRRFILRVARKRSINLRSDSSLRRRCELTCRSRLARTAAIG